MLALQPFSTDRHHRNSLPLSPASHLCFHFFPPFTGSFHSHSLRSSSITTFRWRGSGIEPKWRSQGRHGPVDVAPRVDKNKDLHILMNKTPSHLGRGLGEKRKEWEVGGRWSEDGEKEGLGSFGINLVGIPQGYANVFWVAALRLFISVARSLWPLCLVRAVASSVAPKLSSSSTELEMKKHREINK